MSEESRPARREPNNAEERPAASLLVRCWLEPQPRAEEAPILRGYVRNLKTGEERFIKDVDGLGQQILRSLEPSAADTSSELDEPREAREWGSRS